MSDGRWHPPNCQHLHPNREDRTEETGFPLGYPCSACPYPVVVLRHDLCSFLCLLQVCAPEPSYVVPSAWHAAWNSSILRSRISYHASLDPFLSASWDSGDHPDAIGDPELALGDVLLPEMVLGDGLLPEMENENH